MRAAFKMLRVVIIGRNTFAVSLTAYLVTTTNCTVQQYTSGSFQKSATGSSVKSRSGAK